jgi:Uma2 family endonuclease
MISIILKQLFRYDSQNEDVINLIVPEGWLRTGDGQDRMADIAVYLTENATSVDHIYDLVPDLIFEVISQGSEERDYVIKRKEYFDAGVSEYVIVDPFRKVITVLTRGDHEYTDREIQNGALYQSSQLPDFEFQTNILPW